MKSIIAHVAEKWLVRGFAKLQPVLRYSALDLGAFAQAPQLKSRRGDRFLDGFAREVVGRGAARRDRPGDDPGTVLARQVVDIGIGGECARRSVEADLKTYMRMALHCPSGSGCDRFRIDSPRAWNRSNGATSGSGPTELMSL